jgi:VCBS repeat-containing protein
MNQGDGSDLPGLNGPRKSDIGIIYVAPSDDRQSVLAAILTQEKLGRKQVAIVLPDQNKAFQRPVDFDGLKNMRRGLRTNIVFVAPGGSGPAELARQRRFPVYSSLENYAKFVREDGQRTQVKRKGWLSPLSRQRPADASADTPTDPVGIRQVHPLPDAEEAPAPVEQAAFTNGNEHDNPGILSDAAVVGAATVLDSGILAAGNGASPAPADLEDKTDVLPVASPVAEEPVATHSVSEDTTTSELSGVLPPTASPSKEEDAGAKIIPISSARGRATGKLAIPAIASIPAAQPRVPQMPAASSSTTIRRQSAGKVAAVGAGVGLAAAGAVGAPRIMRAGGTPPPRGSVGPGGGPAGPRRPIRRGLLITLVALLLALLAVFGSIAFAFPGLFNHLNVPIPGVTSSATVTITPASKDLKNTYTIFGVTGNPVQTLRQVEARQLSYTTPAQSKSATATGIGHTPGVPASGTITFYNGSTVDRLVGAGTAFTVNGIQIVTDRAVDVPPANPPAAFGVASVSAHAASVGPVGDIGALSINGTCCSGSSDIVAKNINSFGGGQDPKTFSVVEQSDIDGAANPLRTMLMSAAMQSLQSQVHPTEKFISSPQCTPNVGADHSAGDQASSVTVTVKVSCSGEVYDQQGVQTIAANLLKQQAATELGSSYALVGSLVTGITKVQLANASKGTLEFIVNAEGIWVYQFSDAQKAMLAKLIAGKSKQAAQALLLQQMGIASVAIQITGGDGKTLPTDVGQITITVLTVPGLQGPSPTTSPTSGPGPGTPTTPSGAPGAPTATPTITPTVGLGSNG